MKEDIKFEFVFFAGVVSGVIAWEIICKLINWSISL